MEAQYGKFLDMIRAIRINVPLVDVLPGMPNIDVIDEILEEDFDALLDEVDGSGLNPGGGFRKSRGGRETRGGGDGLEGPGG
nr:reverse transcriptase domain-containing protein [Tanacetum cinerariifolium]